MSAIGVCFDVSNIAFVHNSHIPVSLLTVMCQSTLFHPRRVLHVSLLKQTSSFTFFHLAHLSVFNL